MTLTLVHIMGLPFTGTSVNPARSIGPAILTGGLALEQLWVFIVAPIVGGILAALFYKYVISAAEKECCHASVSPSEFIEIEEEIETVEEPKETVKKTTKKTIKSIFLKLKKKVWERNRF